MKANMRADGLVVLVPDTGIEAFALTRWAAEKLADVSLPIIIDCSNFPSMLGLHASDCAVHNEPAYPAGPCDCGASVLRNLT